MIFIAVMVILNIVTLSEEKNSRAESVNQISLPQKKWRAVEITATRFFDLRKFYLDLFS